jgi:hypothetical protein
VQLHVCDIGDASVRPGMRGVFAVHAEMAMMYPLRCRLLRGMRLVLAWLLACMRPTAWVPDADATCQRCSMYACRLRSSCRPQMMSVMSVMPAVLRHTRCHSSLLAYPGPRLAILLTSSSSSSSSSSWCPCRARPGALEIRAHRQQVHAL